MGKESAPRRAKVPRVETNFAASSLPLPHPGSLPTLEKLRSSSLNPCADSRRCVDRAEDIFVYDKHGNKWLDWEQRRAVTNAGHARPSPAGDH